MLPEDETFLRYYSLAGLYERLREDAALYPTRWTSATAPGRSCSSSSAWSTTAPRPAGCGCPRATACSSTPTASRSSRAALRRGSAPDRRADRAAARARRHRLPRAREAPRPRRRAHLLPRARRRADRLGLRDDDGLPARDARPGRSVAIKAQKKHGAPTAVDLEALLAEPRAKRAKWLQDRADRKLTDKVKTAVAAAATLEDLHAALAAGDRPAATPDLVPQGAMVLQPSEERRRSGSHYTPRSLTEPIVRTTLEPILARLRGEDGRPPAPGADSRPQGLRPGDGLGRVPRRGLPPARRRARRGVARPRRTCPRSRRTRTR